MSDVSAKASQSACVFLLAHPAQRIFIPLSLIVTIWITIKGARLLQCLGDDALGGVVYASGPMVLACIRDDGGGLYCARGRTVSFASVTREEY
ncbi:MAG: hypothetical protein M1396_05620 [Chloroflexi bacterium]|nr:hypothetical protein [Chloroflexota bacterium]